MRAGARLTISLIFTALIVAGCSTRLAYQQLDLLLPWYVSGYVTLDPAQKQLLDARLDERLTWHCSSQIGAYAELLRTLEARIAAGDALTAAELEQFLQRGEAHWRELVIAVTPDLHVLLAALDAQQVDELAAAFAKRNRETHEKFLDGTPDQLRTGQIKRMEKRLQTWFGRLQQSQRQQVAAWSAGLAPTTTQWLQLRAEWQAELLAATAQRTGPGFEERLAALLASPEARWPASYRAQVAHNRSLTLALVADIFNSAGADQRAHLRTEISDWAGQFERLVCTVPAAPTVSTAATTLR